MNFKTIIENWNNFQTSLDEQFNPASIEAAGDAADGKIPEREPETKKEPVKKEEPVTRKEKEEFTFPDKTQVKIDPKTVYMLDPVLINKKSRIGSGFKTANRPNHRGSDHFYALGTPVYAAQSGTLVYGNSRQYIEREIKKFLDENNLKIGKSTVDNKEDYGRINGVFDADGKRYSAKTIRRMMIKQKGINFKRRIAAGCSVKIMSPEVHLKYFHLDSVIALTGPVKAGQLIGTIGKTGMFDLDKGQGAPHLHFEVWLKGFDNVDPADYILEPK